MYKLRMTLNTGCFGVHDVFTLASPSNKVDKTQGGPADGGPKIKEVGQAGGQYTYSIHAYYGRLIFHQTCHHTG
jgi:hypothetical protein